MIVEPGLPDHTDLIKQRAKPRLQIIARRRIEWPGRESTVTPLRDLGIGHTGIGPQTQERQPQTAVGSGLGPDHPDSWR